MTKKKIRVFTLLLFLFPIALMACVFMYQTASDYIRTYKVKPIKSIYAEGTLTAFNYSDEKGIELPYALYFHHYRSHPTQITGTFTLNGETCTSFGPGLSSLSPEPRSKRMAMKRRGLTYTAVFYGANTGEPFDGRNYEIIAKAIIKSKRQIFWQLIIHDETANQSGIYYAPAATFEEAYAVAELIR